MTRSRFFVLLLCCGFPALLPAQNADDDHNVVDHSAHHGVNHGADEGSSDQAAHEGEDYGVDQGAHVGGDHEAHDEPDDGAGHGAHHGHHNMTVDMDGAVMNENFSTLPRGCTGISRDYQFTVRAGRTYANEPGMIFGMSETEIRVEPCSRIELTFINEDEVRHQWMVHGLPKYLYPAGMFHLEAVGGAQKTGTFIVPGDDQTYLLHCDLAQHMEKGMRGQLVVGRGSGNLWAVSGISDDFIRSSYLPRNTAWWLAAALLAGFIVALKIKAFR